eukprot:7947-Chlamydomonas_euryale.AAC.1
MEALPCSGFVKQNNNSICCQLLQRLFRKQHNSEAWYCSWKLGQDQPAGHVVCSAVQPECRAAVTWRNSWYRPKDNDDEFEPF